MRKKPAFYTVLTFVTLLLALITLPAQAYVGPGSGLSAVGTIVALVIGLLVAIVGFVWYPLKRLFKGRNSKEQAESTEAPESPEGKDPASGEQQ